MVQSVGKQAVPRWTGVGFALAGLGLPALFLFGTSPHGLHAGARTDTFIWRAVEAGTGVIVAGVLSFGHRSRAKDGREPGRLQEAPPSTNIGGVDVVGL